MAITTTRKFTVAVTTDGAGAATVFSPKISGRVASIHYVKNNFTDGVDFTITAENSGETLWAELNVNAATSRYPRAPTYSGAGVASLYAAAGTAVFDMFRLTNDRVKIVIAQGGAGTLGSFIIITEDY